MKIERKWIAPLLILAVVVAVVLISLTSNPTPRRDAAQTAPAQRSHSTVAPFIIESTKLRFEEMTDEYVQGHGQVRNLSGDTLNFVKVIVSIYDLKGSFLKSESDYIDVQHLPPGQASPFSLNIRRPTVKWTYTLQFIDTNGVTLRHREIE